MLSNTAFGQAAVTSNANQACPGNGSGYTCHTGLGEIPTKPTELISKIFAILLGLSGGIAVVLIIISGYQLIASAGVPEKVQAAREGLTAAVTGLLFVIFSLVILEIIGVNLLHLPGFSH